VRVAGRLHDMCDGCRSGLIADVTWVLCICCVQEVNDIPAIVARKVRTLDGISLANAYAMRGPTRMRLCVCVPLR
jgi:hypothetical protein